MLSPMTCLVHMTVKLPSCNICIGYAAASAPRTWLTCSILPAPFLPHTYRSTIAACLGLSLLALLIKKWQAHLCSLLTAPQSKQAATPKGLGLSMPLPGRRANKRAAGPTASSFLKPLPDHAAALAVPLSRACC